MSPPLVSLSKKEPLKPAFDEIPDKKPDNVDDASVITVDTDRRSRNIRRQAKQKQCRIIICALTLLIIVAVAAALTFTLVKLLRKHRSSWTIPNSAGLSTDVTVDDEKQLIHAKHNKDDDDDKSNGHTVVIAILHDFSRHLIAYRDVANSTCYIDRLDETFETGYQRWESYEKNGREPKALKVIDNKPIEVEVLKHIGDIHIYGHCVSGNSYWVMEVEEIETETAIRVVYA